MSRALVEELALAIQLDDLLPLLTVRKQEGADVTASLSMCSFDYFASSIM